MKIVNMKSLLIPVKTSKMLSDYLLKISMQLIS